ncbi:hypothetical protein AGMMS50230_17350 [Spirochaetia bacterium]|nr:hypothetical protein AGMMS50230_17350 [Spirochaetia bacterium]
MHKYILLIFLMLTPLLGWSQTGSEIETLLAAPKLTYAQAARFVLEASETVAIDNPEEAFRFAAERLWLPKNAAPAGTARLNGISLLIMQSFGLKGGLFYSAFKNPHFAYREMVYRELILGRADPDMAVSGDDLLFMVNRLLAFREAEAEASAVTAAKAEAAAAEAAAAKAAATATATATAAAAERERLRAEREALTAAEVTAAEAAAAAERERLRVEREALAQEINTRLSADKVIDTTARATNEGVTISLSNIQFLANSAELPESEKAKLREIAGILKTMPGRRILVSGHTAQAGTEAERQRTSLLRAQAAADYLVSQGARSSGEIIVRGYGSDQPLASNSTDEGRALNRRVEITILEGNQ